jgi:hypothetical protein
MREIFSVDAGGEEEKWKGNFPDAQLKNFLSLFALSQKRLTCGLIIGSFPQKSPPLSLLAAAAAFFIHDKFFRLEREREKSEKSFSSSHFSFSSVYILNNEAIT